MVMKFDSLNILLYPYPHQNEAFFTGLLLLVIVGGVLYGLYRLITWKMRPNSKLRFKKHLIITGISLAALFFIELSISLITIHQVNNQLGFTYATPDTPEGELFEIQKVVPGKTMDRAGLKPLDRVQMWNVNHLYILLINNQGKEVEIPVIREGEKMTIKVIVPELDVPLYKASFIF